MKNPVILVVSLLLALVSVTAFCADAAPSADAKFTTITELISAKDSPTGPVRFEGKVVKVFPKEKMLGLADPEKCKTDCATPCEPQLLPVKWEGAMPEVNANVRVTGEVSKADGKKVFTASSLKAVKSACCDQ